MTLQTSGAIALSQIQTELGGANPISLSEYYRNGAYTYANNTSVPTSGAISMSQFYGAVNGFTLVQLVTGTAPFAAPASSVAGTITISWAMQFIAGSNALIPSSSQNGFTAIDSYSWVIRGREDNASAGGSLGYKLDNCVGINPFTNGRTSGYGLQRRYAMAVFKRPSGALAATNQGNVITNDILNATITRGASPSLSIIWTMTEEGLYQDGVVPLANPNIKFNGASPEVNFLGAGGYGFFSVKTFTTAGTTTLVTGTDVGTTEVKWRGAYIT